MSATVNENDDPMSYCTGAPFGVQNSVMSYTYVYVNPLFSGKLMRTSRPSNTALPSTASLFS